MKFPKISIIIPLYRKTAQFYEAVDKCLELNYSRFEVIVVVDLDINIPLKNPKLKILRTGKKNTGPAEKRDTNDLSLRHARPGGSHGDLGPDYHHGPWKDHPGGECVPGLFRTREPIRGRIYRGGELFRRQGD